MTRQRMTINNSSCSVWTCSLINVYSVFRKKELHSTCNGKLYREGRQPQDHSSLALYKPFMRKPLGFSVCFKQPLLHYCISRKYFDLSWVMKGDIHTSAIKTLLALPCNHWFFGRPYIRAKHRFKPRFPNNGTPIDWSLFFTPQPFGQSLLKYYLQFLC